MADNKIVVSTTSNNKNNVQITTGNSSGNISVDDDLTNYYANIAREWAVKMDGKVLKEDYSSKYYATQAIESANNAKSNADRVQGLADTFDNTYQVYTTELEETKTEVINDITTAKLDFDNAAATAQATLLETEDKALSNINESADSVIERISGIGFTGLEVAYNPEQKSLVFTDINYMELSNKLDVINGEVV